MPRLHVKPDIGNVQLRKITGSTLRGLIASLNVADKYAGDIFDLVSSILTAAVDDKLLARNPAKDPSVRRQKPRAPKRKVPPWADEWVEKMYTAIHDRYKITVTLGAGLGLRQGEIFGLAIEDDYVKDVVWVRREVKMVGKKLTFAPPKARKDDDAPREIPLPPDVTEALDAHLRRYPAKERHTAVARSRTRHASHGPSDRHDPERLCPRTAGVQRKVVVDRPSTCRYPGRRRDRDRHARLAALVRIEPSRRWRLPGSRSRRASGSPTSPSRCGPSATLTESSAERARAGISKAFANARKALKDAENSWPPIPWYMKRYIGGLSATGCPGQGPVGTTG